MEAVMATLVTDGATETEWNSSGSSFGLRSRVWVLGTHGFFTPKRTSWAMGA